MALVKTTYGNYTLLEGTAVEVAGGLNANNVPKGKAMIGGVTTAAFAIY
jgi:hypothetical protein